VNFSLVVQARCWVTCVTRDHRPY